MQIQFDAGNDAELAAVFAMIVVLRNGDLSLPLLDGPNVGVDRTGVHVPAAPAAPPAPPVPPAAEAPPAPVPPAPPAAPPAPPAAPAAGAVDVDKDGLPWDARIHSTPATKKADGKWRARRNLDAATKEAVTAELRATMAAPGAPPPPGAPVPPPLPSEPVVDAATAFGAGGAANVSEPPVVPPAPPVVPPAPPAAPPAPPVDPLAAAMADGWMPHPTSDGYYYKGEECVATADMLARYEGAPAVPPAPDAAGLTFADLMRSITTLQAAGTLTVQRTQEIAAELGLDGVRGLMARPDLIPAFNDRLPKAGG